MLRDVSSVDLSVWVLGRQLDMPVCVAATAMQRMAHPDGETATARGRSGARTRAPSKVPNAARGFRYAALDDSLKTVSPRVFGPCDMSFVCSSTLYLKQDAIQCIPHHLVDVVFKRSRYTHLQP